MAAGGSYGPKPACRPVGRVTPEDIARLPYRACVGLVLAHPDGRIFAGQRNDRHRDAWQMPQGGIDAGEALREAGLRELQEETGLMPGDVRIEAETGDWVTYELPVDLVPNIWKGRYRGQKQKWLLLRLLADDSAIDIATEHPEFSAWQWMRPADLLDAIVPFKREVYEAVLTEFAPQL